MILAGKIALVTGGSQGIGAAAALELAREGADVCVTYRSHEAEANDCIGPALLPTELQHGCEARRCRPEHRDVAVETPHLARCEGHCADLGAVGRQDRVQLQRVQ